MLESKRFSTPEIAISTLIFGKYDNKKNKVIRKEYHHNISYDILKNEIANCDFFQTQIIEEPKDLYLLRVKTTYINGTLISQREGQTYAKEIMEQFGTLVYDSEHKYYIRGKSGFVYPLEEGDTNISYKL